MILPAIGLIVVALIFVATGKEILWEANRDLDTLSRQAAKEIASEVSALSATEQGVRFYDMPWAFTVGLDSEKVSVSYTDDDKKAHSYAFPHTASVEGSATVTGPAKVCISKKFDGCASKITICKEGEACCSTSKSTCFFAG